VAVLVSEEEIHGGRAATWSMETQGSGPKSCSGKLAPGVVSSGKVGDLSHVKCLLKAVLKRSADPVCCLGCC